ncbi:hypothetical protein LZ554_008471 [Drepanopeziza brunnea f. sp. 'monogermtubi']|nr:hypothetical protein LZ554_008471 [Drepanopeziza brunnea f. sp. 'monogermtubi']
MGRGKGVVLDLRATPPQVLHEEAVIAPLEGEVMPTSSEISHPPPPPPHPAPLTTKTSSTCSNCSSTFEKVTTEDFMRHVASCPAQPLTYGSDSDESSVLSSPPNSPVVDHLSSLKPRDEDAAVHEDLGNQDLGVLHAGHQVVTDGNLNEQLLKQNMRREFAKVSAYVKGEYTIYDSEDEEDMPDASAAPSDTEDPRASPVPNGKSSLQAYQSSKSGTPTPETPDEFDGTESPQKAEIPTSHPTPLIAKDAAALAKRSQSPKDLGSSSNTLKVSEATSSAVPSQQPTPEIKPTRLNKSGIRFKKLTPILTHVNYLANPEDMSYETLYYRTSVTTKALVKLQEEYDLCDKQTSDYEIAKKYAAKIAAEAKKEEDEKLSAESDAELLRLHAQYREQLRMSFRDYNAWVSGQEEASDPDVVPPIHWEFMRNIKNPDIMGKVNKRRKANEKEAAKPVTLLEDTPLPALRRGDDEIRKKRALFLDPVVFEDRKTADVYMADYSKNRDAIGFQVFKDRRVTVPTEEVDENGRPKRNRGKRALDTEQTNTPGDSGDEDAPLGKRRRTTRAVQELPTSPARRAKIATREGSPHVATFKSGKRIGRPPKPKGEAAATVPKTAPKSKLQQSHLPPASEPGDREESEDELPDGESRELEEGQEAELQEAAEALVQQTKEQPTNGKKNTKIVFKVISDEDKKSRNAVKSSSKKKGGRAAAKPKAARGGRGKKAVAQESHMALGDNNDIIQSTEQDDMPALYPLANSRPSTSSSVATGSTSGHASRAASGEDTQEQTTRGVTATVNEVATTNNPKAKGGKRKRAVVADSIPAPVQPAAPAPAPKKRKTSGKKHEELIPKAEEDLTVTPDPAGEMNGEYSTTASGRPKRKRAVTTTESVYVSHPIGDDDEFGQEEASPARPKRRKAGKARGVKKGKHFKEEASESEYNSDAGDGLDEEVAEVQPKKRAARVGVKKNFAEQTDDDEEEAEVEDKIAPSPKRLTFKAKGKGKGVLQEPSRARKSSSVTNAQDALTYRGSEISSVTQTPTDMDLPPAAPEQRRMSVKKAAQQNARQENGIDYTGLANEDDGEGDVDAAAAEALRKKLEKNRKISASTTLKWRTGQMAVPMAKRNATNANKKAEKNMAAHATHDSHFDAPFHGGVPASAFPPSQFFMAIPQPMPYPNTTYAQPPPPPQYTHAYAHPGPYQNLHGGGPFSMMNPGAPNQYPHGPGMYPYPSHAPHPQHLQYSVPPAQAPTPIPQAPPPEPRRPATKRKPAGAKKPSNNEDMMQAGAHPPPAAILPRNFYSQPAPAPAVNSTRARKPSRLALDQDGAAEERDDVEPRKHQFKSEYEHYQALSAPRSPYTLGKRRRRPVMDLSSINNDDDDEL